MIMDGQSSCRLPGQTRPDLTADSNYPARPEHSGRLAAGGLVLCAVVLGGAVVLCSGSAWAQGEIGFDPYQSSHSSPLQPLTLYDASQDTVQWLGGNPHWPSSPTESPGMHRWQALPTDTIYPFYLGDVKASRLSAIYSGGEDQMLDATLGGRFGLLRYNRGRTGPFLHGAQLDVEGSAQLRLSPSDNMDFQSVDFRAGVPLSFGFGRLHTRLGYYHLSSHVGDEFLLKRPRFNRLNFSRDVLYAGAGYWLTPQTRVYGESGWAFYNDISEEWEFMFGLERAPRFGTGVWGGLFYAVHAHLREELDYSGHFTGQIGWAWRRDERSGVLRIGLNYFNGKSPQYSFFREHEQQLGLGLWYDF